MDESQVDTIATLSHKMFKGEITLYIALSTTIKYLKHASITCCFLFVCFVSLRPKSTAMVMAGRSVHLTTLFLGHA